MYSCVFFFKQKTAYEMRISDWSSDVCSSDLTSAAPSVARKPRPASVSASTCDRQRVTPCHLFALSPARANLIPVATGRRLCKRGAWPLARHVGLVMKCECIGGLCCGGYGDQAEGSPGAGFGRAPKIGRAHV